MRLWLVLLLSAPLALARGQEAVPALLDRGAVLKSAAEVSLKKYPDADAVLVDDFVRVTYQHDGTDETWDDSYTKVLTEKGRQDLQALSYGYDVVYDTVTVVRVEIIKPDGRAENVDIASQSKSMVDRSQMAMNIYDPNSRTLQVSLPNVEVGDVVHAVTRHRNFKTRMPDTWIDYQVFEYTAPMKHYTYEVNAPASRPLAHAELKDPVPGTVTSTTNRAGDRIVYRWEVRDVPRIFEEPNMPEAFSVVQRLLVSTIADWQTVSKWYWGIASPHFDATTPEMIDKVKELAADAPDDRAKIQALFTYVSQQIRYMGITTETTAPGYEPHDVKITFGNKYGVCRDKAALLVSMLRLAGLKGFPVLIHAGPKKDAGVPMPYFNHAIVAAQMPDGQFVLMDPTNENTAELLPAYLCNKSFLVATPDGEPLRTSPIIPASNNLLRVSSHGKLDEHGSLKLDAVLNFDGINDNSYRGYFAEISPAERRRFFDQRLGQMLPGATMTSFEIEPANLRDTTVPMKITLACEVPNFQVESDTHRMLTLPWIGHGFGVVNHVLGQTGLEKRRFTLETEIACGVEETVDLELNEAASPLAVPHVPDIGRDDLEFRQSVACAGNHITGKAAFLLKAVEYPPARYASLKQSLRDIEFARRQRVVLPQAIVGAPNPDAEFLKRTISIDVKNEHEWTSTEDYTIRILSYSGKKRLSELHLDFNPVWEDITVTNATVTGRDGKVQTLAAQELNTMDAAWVASAPRYPAAKTLVASLPGVDVGSTIHYTVIKHRRDRPFFSSLVWFRGVDPVREATMMVSTPSSMKLREWMSGEVKSIPTTSPDRITTRTWTITNQPAVFREENMPPGWAYTPTVALSAGDWSRYADEVISPMVKAAKGNPESRKLAKQLAKKSGGKMEKATAIRDAIDRAVRLAGPQADDLPVSILTPADQTLREGYGNSRDRALLVYVMLEEAGFKPEFVLVSSACPTLPDLRDRWMSAPQGSTFDTVLVRAEIDGHEIYFNDTDQYARLGSTPHDGRSGLTRDGKLVAIEAQPDQQNKMKTFYDITLDANGDAIIAVEQTFEGMDYAGVHKQMAEQTPEDRRRFAQETVAVLSQAATLKGDFVVNDKDYPAKLSFTATVPRFAVRDGKFLYFNLPAQHGMRLPGASAERKNPFYDETKTDIAINHVLHLPAGEIVVAPASFTATAPEHLATASLATVAQGGTNPVLVHEFHSFDPALVPAHSYDDLKAWNARVRHPSNRAFMLKLAE